jgi:hypothetical protein
MNAQWFRNKGLRYAPIPAAADRLSAVCRPEATIIEPAPGTGR